ncbi:hypothetical protein Hamer_G000385 [Homarus americanus]|uniref:Uncharacterized protein n=1 Tax=Homarus americanus TaxID=6706 RepID=A0A8J5NCD0_HOMAM|nr:hypothetical protein Hamer_G000385 [Homarus americanus]
MVVVVVCWCSGVEGTPLPIPQQVHTTAAALLGPVTGPRAPLAPAFTPEVAAARQAFLQEFNAQAAIAAQFPDDPDASQPTPIQHTPTQATQPSPPQLFTFPVAPTHPSQTNPAHRFTPTNVQAQSTTFHSSSNANSVGGGRSVVPIAPTFTIPEAYVQFHNLLIPPPTPTVG